MERKMDKSKQEINPLKLSGEKTFLHKMKQRKEKSSMG